MHFLLLGATGRSGKVLLQEALSQGHTVTALVRDTSKLPAQNGLTLVKGTPMSASDVEAAIATTSTKRIDAVLVTLGIQRESGSPWAKPISPPDLMEKSIGNVATAMKKHGIRSLVVQSAWGVGSSFYTAPYLIQGMIYTSSMGPQFEDHDAANNVVKGDAGIDAVFFRPARLTGKPKAPVVWHGDDGQGLTSISSISVPSVAGVLVEAAVKGDQWGKTPVITN